MGRIDRGSALLVGLGSLAYAGFAFVWFALPAYLTPITAELGLSSTEAGLITGAIPLTYVPLALASGLVIDRIGPGRAIGVGLALLGSAGALRGLADGFPVLFATMVLLGVGGTGITFGLPKLVSVVVPPAGSGTATSIYVVGAAVGTAAAFSLARPVLGPALGGWRPLFAWSGLAVLGVAFLWGVAVRWVGDDGAEPAASDPARRPGVREDLRAVLTHRDLRLLVVVGAMLLFAMHGSQAWLPTIFESRGVPVGRAALLTTGLVVARTVGILLIPPISDAIGRRRIVLIASGVAVATGSTVLLGSGTRLPLSVSAVGLVGVGLGGLSPLVRTVPIELDGIGPRLTGAATGLIFAVGQVGGFLGPLMVGWTFDLTGGYGPGIALLGIAGAVVVGAGWAMPETAGRRTEATPDPAD